MSIAKKLCKQIVEPALQVPSYGSYVLSTTQSRKNAPARAVPTSSKRSTSTTRSRNSVEKKKAPTPPPRPPPPPRFTSIDVIGPMRYTHRRTFKSRGINTHVAGPLLCDNECLTNVRSRDDTISKNYSHGRNCRLSKKQTQTAVQQRNDKNVNTDPSEKVTESVDEYAQYEDRLDKRSMLKRVNISDGTTSPLFSSKLSNNYRSKRWALSRMYRDRPDF